MSDEKPQQTACGQCGKAAILELNGVPLCVDCEFRFQQSRWMVFVQNATMMNHADAEMAAAIGMPHLRNPIAIPPAPIPPIHYNNQSVNVTGGQVGAVNFGTVGSIQTTVGSLNEQGSQEVAAAIAKLTNAILETAEADEALKNEMLEQTSFLADQALAKPSDRKVGTVKAVARAIRDVAATVGGVATAWQAVEPIVATHFGISF